MRVPSRTRTTSGSAPPVADFSHPAFAPYRALIADLDLSHALPGLDRLNAVATSQQLTQAQGHALRFVSPSGRLAARDYENHILATGEIPTRHDTWHDVLNALVWLRFPRFKAALNAAHGTAMSHETDSLRGRRRDALTVLDESGVWVTSDEPALFPLLANHDWTTLFVAQRHTVIRAMRFVVVGHALLEKALAPYPAITGKCLLLEAHPTRARDAETDAIAALATLASPRQLLPLPVQGIPGWDAANASAVYYANTAIFRPPAELRRPPPSAAPSPGHQTDGYRPT